MIQGVDFKAVPTHAIEDRRAAVVIAAAEEFAAAPPEQRSISLTLLCELDPVRRLTHGDAGRTATVVRIADLLTNKRRTDTAVNECL